MVKAKVSISKFEVREEINNNRNLDMGKLQQNRYTYNELIKERIPDIEELKSNTIDEINDIIIKF